MLEAIESSEMIMKYFIVQKKDNFTAIFFESYL